MKLDINKKSLIHPDLVEYGWDEVWESNLPQLDLSQAFPARVISEHRDRYWVHSETKDYSARVSGKIKHQATMPDDFPAVGDWVVIKPQGEESGAVIQAILPRRSKFSRKTVGKRTEEQVIAANLDMVWIISSFDFDLNPARLERYITLVVESGAKPVLLLTKADLSETPQTIISDLMVRLVDVPVYAVSVVEPQGIDALRHFLEEGTTIALLGSSGVGKSTLINHLAGSDVMHTAPVREKDGKGRHTTTHRELILLPGGGLLLDTPGMREIQLWGPEEALEKGFADIEKIAEGCRFSDCSHGAEPGCAVHEALEKGKIPQDRIDNYKKLREELVQLERNQEVRTGIANKQRRKTYTREPRHKFKDLS